MAIIITQPLTYSRNAVEEAFFTISQAKWSLRIGKNIEYILATFRGAVNLKDIATFRRGGAPYVDQYFGASGRPASARGQKFFWDLRARMAVFNDFAPPCMYSMCDRLGWISLGRILIHIIFLFPMDGTGDGFGRLVLRSAYGTAPHPFGGLNFTRAQRRVVKRGEARQGAQSQRESIFRAAFR